MAPSLLETFICFYALFGVTFGANVECNDKEECVGLHLDTSNNDEVIGNGYKSIYGPTSSINSSDLTSCYGALSCSFIKFIETKDQNTECDGDNSCSHTNLIKGEEKVECTGSSACSFSTIKSEIGAICEGAYSCSHTYVIIILHIFNSFCTKNELCWQ